METECEIYLIKKALESPKCKVNRATISYHLTMTAPTSRMLATAVERCPSLKQMWGGPIFVGLPTEEHKSYTRFVLNEICKITVT